MYAHFRHLETATQRDTAHRCGQPRGPHQRPRGAGKVRRLPAGCYPAFLTTAQPSTINASRVRFQRGAIMTLQRQMRGRYNRLKLHALSVFERRGWLSAQSWAMLATFEPVRAAYSYLRFLYKQKLLDRAFDERGMLVYRINRRGLDRLAWLRTRMGDLPK